MTDGVHCVSTKNTATIHTMRTEPYCGKLALMLFAITVDADLDELYPLTKSSRLTAPDSQGQGSNYRSIRIRTRVVYGALARAWYVHIGP